MDKVLCFSIEHQELYLEQTLVEYMGVPIFFICNDTKQYYLALCVDIDELHYFVIEISPRDLFDLLHGNIPMRDVFFKQNTFWKIESAEEPANDVVVKCLTADINCDMLPKENAVFEILTKDVAEYVQKFDSVFWLTEYNDVTNTQINASDYFSIAKNITVDQYIAGEYFLQGEHSKLLHSYNKQMFTAPNYEWLTEDSNVWTAA